MESTKILEANYKKEMNKLDKKTDILMKLYHDNNIVVKTMEKVITINNEVNITSFQHCMKQLNQLK